MSADIIVPKLGLTETHATVVRWRKAVGDQVSVGDVVAEIQADKADVDIEAGADGVIAEILIGEGIEVELGTVIGRISRLSGSVLPDGPDRSTQESVLRGLVSPAPAPAPEPVAAPVGLTGLASTRTPSSPLARRVAAELGVGIAGLAGSGPGGLVVARDVRAVAAAGSGAPAAPAPVRAVAPTTMQPESVPAAAARIPDLPGVGALRELELSRVRRVTARRLVAAAAVPAVTLHRRAGIDQARVAVAVSRAQGVRATLTHAVLAACAYALPKHPELNGFWIDDRLYLADRVNLGIAVDVDGQLRVAVAEDCASKPIAEIATTANAAVADARSGRPGQGAQATFTVSNLGMLGIEQFTPVLNPPETGILGVGAVVDGQIGLSLTFDHRAIDGAPAARFLDAVARELAGF